MFVMAQKKSGAAGRKPNRTNEVSVQFYADRETVDALSAYLSSLPPDLKVSKRGILVAALRNYLASKGAWPPKPPKPAEPKK